MTGPRSRPPAWLAVAGAAVAACHPGPPARTAEVARTPLAAAGELIAAVEHGDALYLVAPDRVTIERGGAAVATVAAPDGRWAEAVAMPALDDAGTWVVARTTTGSLWRIALTGDLAPIHDRLGLPPRARSIASSGASSSVSGGASSGAGAAPDGAARAAPDASFAVALDDSVAILRDRAHLAWFPASAPGALLASPGRVAVRRGDQLDVWNLADLTHAGYTVPGALAAGFVTPPAAPGSPARGALVVATRSALYVEAAGRLHRIAAPAEIRALAVAGSHVWVATVRGVFLVDGGAFVATAVATAAADHLFGLDGGDLVIAAPAGVVRLSVAGTGDDPRWDAEVRPIFDRVCANCHRPQGSARVDLSTLAAWRTEHAELVRRVVETRTMPPAGTALGDAERRTLSRWLSR